MESDHSQQSSAKQDTAVKFEAVESKRQRVVDRKLRKKINCHMHNQKIAFKCADKGCQQPYMCLHPECLDTHFHSPVLSLTKIDTAAIEKKFELAQTAIANTDRLFNDAIQIKAVIDSLKSSVASLFKDVGGMGKAFGELKADVDTALSNAFLGKVEEALKIENKISASIERIKSKINIISHPSEPIQQPEQSLVQDFFMKGEICGFLQANIANFDWKTATTVINTHKQDYSCTEFHEALAGKSDLVFLFVGENMLAGSYFSASYPPSDGILRDPASFIFAAKQDPTPKILKFLANSDSSHHLQVSSEFYVSQGHLEAQSEGLRIGRGSIDVLQVGLPTESYAAENISEWNLNQSIKLTQILVLQVGSTTD